MITYIKGIIREINQDPCSIIVLANDIGYQINLPVFVYESIKLSNLKKDDFIELEIYYHITERQPKPLLVGFRHAAERTFFEQLVQVEGIGPIKAASALVLPVSTIASAIETEDISILQQLPGIGNRAAQKIIATLRGKVSATALLRDGLIQEIDDNTKQINIRNEAIEALLTLGYRNNEAKNQVDEVINKSSEVIESTEDIIKEVFKNKIK
ncbi:MAG: hypothetical protein CL778_04215 [Chloroflexi bacterium]|nr:hypothetical protein [Chloroflexota bacterium]|tara:strand:- start:33720 stop:34355 length:636 start_codon:yes stop_codon:yes gene_type:complete